MVPVVSRIAPTVILAAATLAATGFLSSCGGSPATDSAASSPASSSQAPANHNADDLAFVRHMIPHHQQAIQMTEMVSVNTSNTELIALADEIATKQTMEFQILLTFKAQWEEGEGSQGDHSGMDMAGMVDQATMEKLMGLRDEEFDQLWLQSMIAHHQGAIEMAKVENTSGQNPDAVSLANSIIAAQQAEIDRMNQMLGAN